MRKSKYAALLVLIMALLAAGCGNGMNNAAGNPNAEQAAELLKEMGYKIVEYVGTSHSYELTRGMVTRIPHLDTWGAQDVRPDAYFGKSIQVEKFIVKNHPLDKWKENGGRAQGKTVVWVMVSEGQIIGGTSHPYALDNMLGGKFALDGRDIEEVQGKHYHVWKEEWLKEYGG